MDYHVVESENGIDIYIKGYGTFDILDGPPIRVEMRDTKLMVVLHPDITSDETKVVDLSGAKENTMGLMD